MTKDIPFRVKKLTETAKAPTQENAGDLWDLYADDFDITIWEDRKFQTTYSLGGFTILKKKTKNNDIPKTYQKLTLKPQGKILVKTGIALELPKQYDGRVRDGKKFWEYQELNHLPILSYAVADIRPRSGLALKHGITVLNSPGTIDNSYRKEIGVIIHNTGHEPYTISKGDKIAQMLIRPLYPSKMEIVEHSCAN